MVNVVNGISVIATPLSYNALPAALNIATFTVEYMTSFTSDIYGDPSITTGLGLDPKE